MNFSKGLLLCLTLFVCGFFLHFDLKAQSLSPEVIASGGDYFTSPAGSLSWTIGEPVTETVSNNNVILTQGFQQSFITITAIKEPQSKNYQIKVYPNPAVDYVNISLNTGFDEIVTVQVYDLKGEKVVAEKFNSNEIMRLDLSKLAVSNYLLSLRKLNGELITTYQINKNR